MLVLYALSKCQNRAGRLIPYSEIDDVLQRLRLDFGLSRKSYHAQYLFWRLQNDHIWEIANCEILDRRKGNTDVKKNEVIKYDIRGGFTEEIII